ncbi:hypothetical protein MFFC18_46650 [Mariniblastus fucicola]|uniref:Uncharacterized protein n=1 Tax=Mariniblastus fucicola TaxID=980251 RepID=A0A5B9PQZ9_9BACT|nr:hypothetical protein MFFC18_46650 [Mariniblastus fucicola]
MNLIQTSISQQLLIVIQHLLQKNLQLRCLRFLYLAQ